MKYLLKITFLLSIFIFSSCSQENTIEDSIDENSIAKRLKFVDVKSRVSNNKVKIVIVRWDEWGRKRKNCGGWGLCNADWFPGNKSNNSNSNGAETILEYDNSTEKYYIDILLAETVPADIPLDSLTLKIDKDFELNVQEAISQNLTFNEGDYLFNNSLGEFGGYRIYLD